MRAGQHPYPREVREFAREQRARGRTLNEIAYQIPHRFPGWTRPHHATVNTWVSEQAAQGDRDRSRRNKAKAKVPA